MDGSHKKLLPHDPNWKGEYEKEEQILKTIFKDSILDIQHIGSTAVPGLAAKPIIDIAVLLKTHTEAEQFVAPLKELGYDFDEVAHSKGTSPERHFFRKGVPIKFHLSLGYSDKGSFWKRQILFRDYLREHDEAREEYQKIKEKGLEADPTGADDYINQKTDFIFGILEKAGFVKTW